MQFLIDVATIYIVNYLSSELICWIECIMWLITYVIVNLTIIYRIVAEVLLEYTGLCFEIFARTTLVLITRSATVCSMQINSWWVLQHLLASLLVISGFNCFSWFTIILLYRDPEIHKKYSFLQPSLGSGHYVQWALNLNVRFSCSVMGTI